ncbi:MAG: hypothetical protein BMS9Abin17_1096 [Acidimicrobiia bacterium]|nr:MAG: hypothetical protein BMS9Abin17_1096 [Acidimicrobiia bacterium]
MRQGLPSRNRRSLSWKPSVGNLTAGRQIELCESEDPK